ncbi:MAG: flavin reductase family protein [Candidatus Brocadiaceae bacterium]|mgnify:CR=1 FL=1|nr:flavin reductase family protein [Candidatus Brocadiaceae bacterium]
MVRREVEFGQVIGPLHEQMYCRGGGMGVLLTSCGGDGRPNVMTLGWGLFGSYYHDRCVVVVAVRPACHTFKLLADVPEFALCVPTPELAEAVSFCGSASGRDCDKFRETGLTPVPSAHVRPPSIAECPIHVECRIYHPQRPPHMILTPEHRRAPVHAQHTIYFAEVLGAYVREP